MNKVEEAIVRLQIALEMEYMRHALEVRLEPDAFFRLYLEVQRKNKFGTLSPAEFNVTSLKLAGPAGYINIVKDDSLGKNGYVKTYIYE